MSVEKLQPFAEAKYLNLETFKRDGAGVKTPLWFVEKDAVIYVYTLSNAWKVKRIRNNPQVRIAPCDFRGNLKGDWVEAKARIIEGNEEEIAHQLLDKKYGWQKKIGNLVNIFRKRQRTAIAINV
jgi:PPOX class probable F420-dependent enzyme